MKTCFLAISIALVGTLLLGAAPAAATHVACGDTVSGQVVLDSDLLNCPGDGLVVTGHEVTIDLAGHTIDGTGSGAGVGNDAGAEDGSFVVQNGVIREFGVGVSHEEADEGTMLARHLALTGNGTGASCFFSEMCSVQASRIEGSEFSAVGVSYGGGVRLKHNVIRRNGRGVTLGEGANGVIEHNSIAANAGYGIRMHDSGGFRIEHNRISGNGEEGVTTLISAGKQTIARNRILGNGIGVHIQYGVDYSIMANTIAHNTSQGVVVATDTAGEIRRNLIRDNGGDGAEVRACNATVESNAFARNAGDGLLADLGEGECRTSVLRIAMNQARHNAGDGIAVRGNASPVLVERNWARGNADDGIDIATPSFGASELVFSPDGSRYAFVGLGQIFTARADGRDVRRLTNFPDPSISDLGWSPNGSTIVFDDRDDIYSIAASGAGLRRLTTSGDVIRPSWSPDGSLILFVRYVPGLGHLWVMHPDGSGQRDLGQTGDHPQFSPDGRQILFLDRRTGELELWIVEADGSDPQQLTDSPALEREPRWSPQGDRIAYVRDSEGAGVGDLVIRDLAGAERVVTNGVIRFDWSPDGERLVFDRAVGGIYVIGADGTGERELVAPPANPYTQGSPRWSPDGSMIGYRSPSGAAIVKIDGTGQRLVSYPPLTTVSANRADDNAALGIEAGIDVTDGGRNRAARNGDPRQCVGVACKK